MPHKHKLIIISEHHRHFSFVQGMAGWLALLTLEVTGCTGVIDNVHLLNSYKKRHGTKSDHLHVWDLHTQQGLHFCAIVHYLFSMFNLNWKSTLRMSNYVTDIMHVTPWVTETTFGKRWVPSMSEAYTVQGIFWTIRLVLTNRVHAKDAPFPEWAFFGVVQFSSYWSQKLTEAAKLESQIVFFLGGGPTLNGKFSLFRNETIMWIMTFTIFWWIKLYMYACPVFVEIGKAEMMKTMRGIPYQKC